MSHEAPSIDETPIQLDQEWANALTHAIAAAGSIVLGAYLIGSAANVTLGLGIACAAYTASAFGTFLFSTLSHSILRQPALNTLRAWDQAMIYLMIAGTYTPIAFRYLPDQTRAPLLAILWIAAIAGFWSKVGKQYRVNSIGTWSYLLLGWLPAIPLAGHVPSPLVWSMLLGGVFYSIGVIFLRFDRKFRYAHAVWHLFVMTAAVCHWIGILWYVVAM